MAYGVNAPFGLQPRLYLNGTLYNGANNEYSIAYNYGTAIYSGDPVSFSGTGTIIKAAAGAGNVIMGVFMGCQYVDTAGNRQNAKFWPAAGTYGNINATAFVIDDPNVLYDVQIDGAIGNGVTSDDIGKNTNIVYGNPAGSAISGQSTAYISNPVTDAQDSQLKLVRLTPVPGNNFALTANNVLVLINNGTYKGPTLGN